MPRPREPLRTGHRSATSLGPLPRAPCQRRARGCAEHGPCPRGTARLQGRRPRGEHCLRQPAVVGVGDSQPPEHRGPARHRLCSERALSPGLRGHQAVDRVGGAHWARGGGGGAAADRGPRSSSCLGSKSLCPARPGTLPRPPRGGRATPGWQGPVGPLQPSVGHMAATPVQRAP